MRYALGTWAITLVVLLIAGGCGDDKSVSAADASAAEPAGSGGAAVSSSAGSAGQSAEPMAAGHDAATPSQRHDAATDAAEPAGMRDAASGNDANTDAAISSDAGQITDGGGPL